MPITDPPAEEAGVEAAVVADSSAGGLALAMLPQLVTGALANRSVALEASRPITGIAAVARRRALQTLEALAIHPAVGRMALQLEALARVLHHHDRKAVRSEFGHAGPRASALQELGGRLLNVLPREDRAARGVSNTRK